MIKKMQLILWGVLALALVGQPGTAQATVQAGIYSHDAFTFRVIARPSALLDGTLSSFSVTVRWPTASGITLGTVTSSYGAATAGGVGTDGSYSFQTYAGVPGSTINWAQDSENELFRVAVENATGAVTFELTNGPTSTQAWYFEFGGLDSTDYSTPFSPSSTELPLPITLSSFTATLLQGEGGVRIDWRTESEISNYGFYVQRRMDDAEEFADLAESFTPGHGTTTASHEYSFVDRTGVPGTRHYRLKQVDLDKSVHYSEPVFVDVLTDVEEVAPPVFALFQNYPNPFNPATELKFSVERTGPATVRLYNVAGQVVRTLFDGVAEVGRYYRIQLDARNLASGVYFYRLRSESNTDIKKMVLLK